MKEKIIFNNIIINNGIKEYHINDIYENQQMRLLVNSVIGFGGLTFLANEVNEQNGILYIKSNTNFTLGSATLKNVSIETFEKYETKRP